MNFRSRMLREALSFDWLRTKSGHLEGNVRGCCLDTKSLVNGESNEGQRRSTKSTKSHLSNEPGPDGAHHRELRRSTTNQRWERGASRFHSVGGGDLPEIKNRPQRYRHELLLPTVSTQVRYINERTIEIFTSDARGRVELHDILHPNMSRNLSYKVESLDLTDGDPAHRITSRDLVDRTPFSVYGTFDGSVAITKSICSPEIKKISVLKIWQANEPIQLVRVNQLDNGLLAVTNFPHLPVESCLFVLDIAGQRQVALKSRQVFHATSCSKIFDVCWLWDHPARLLLSTVDSIRMFDIRCPNKTEQALYLNHTITHMASNKFRTHIFAAFNGEELHIYDNRQLFGPVQQIKVPIDGYSELNSMRWNPYMPYELFLHFRASSSILRCSAPDLPFDPFRRRTCDSFTSEEVFPMEQIWDASTSSDSIDLRLTRYKELNGTYALESYSEMFNKCKEDPESAMPLCWMAPISEYAIRKGKDLSSINTIPGGCSGFDTAIYRRRFDGSHMRFKTSPNSSPSKLLDRLIYEHTESDLIGRQCKSEDDLRKKNDVMIRPTVISSRQRRTRSLSSLDNSLDLNFLRYDQVHFPKCSDNASGQEPVVEKDGTHDHAPCLATRYSTTFDDGLNESGEVSIEKDLEDISENHKDRLSCVFEQLGLDLNNFSEVRERKEFVVNHGASESLPFVSLDRLDRTGAVNRLTKNNVDSGHRIKLPYKILSFDFAPVGYSGVLCLVEQPNDHWKLVFAPFVAPDEGSAVNLEYAKALEEIRVWESSDSIPFHLYQTMKLRLHNGMDRIDSDTPLLSILQGMADQIPRKWTQWLLNSAQFQNGYCGDNDVGNDVDTVGDDDDLLVHEKSTLRYEGRRPLQSVNVKGLPGILQLSTLESESDVVWHSCDSNHFTYIKIARSPIRRLILAPFRLPIDEERVVSDERFAVSTDVLKQMPVVFLCLINGDSVRFIEYTLFIQRKLGKPVYTDNPCSFLNAFYFFSTIVFRYVNKISGTANRSSPNYVVRRRRLVEKIDDFIKQQSGSSSLNPFFIPMLLFLHGEMTCTHPEAFTKTVLENERMPLSFRIAWCANLLSSTKMKEALHLLFEQSSGINRLQFVGLGRHPDSLTVLSEHLYVTQDCQVFSHLLVAGRCFEDDDDEPKRELTNFGSCSVFSVYQSSVEDQRTASVPSLVGMFPISYLHASNDMSDLLHLARAELYRYCFVLQRLEKYCFRRKLLNLIPQIYWPDFVTSADISCTFCGSSYEVALRNVEAAISDHLSQVKSRITSTKTVASRSSISMAGTLKSPSSSLVAASSDSIANTSVSSTSVTESYACDYNGVDGGTEAEIKRPPDSACPQCRKSYPRCCLCGLPYGTPVNDYDHPAGPFAMMFSTCLMCSHGGHTKHVISWFEKEDECPVIGCDCRCLDFEEGADERNKQTLLAPF